MVINMFSDRILNRRPNWDYRNANYRLKDFITPAMRAVAMGTPVRDWDLPFIPDQGNTGHCVGFGGLNFGNCDPVMDGWPNQIGHDLYYRAKVFDGEPGAENGSSILSGIKAFMELSRLKDNAYAWASNLEDIKVFVLSTGPMYVGTDWLEDMFYPDANGLVNVGGWVAGGHAYLLKGYERETDLFLFANSWGTAFGKNGTFYMRAGDFDRLMAQQGECVAMVEVTSEPVPPPEPPPPAPPPAPAPGCSPVAKLIKWATG